MPGQHAPIGVGGRRLNVGQRVGVRNLAIMAGRAAPHPEGNLKSAAASLLGWFLPPAAGRSGKVRRTPNREPQSTSAPGAAQLSCLRVR